LGQVDVLGHWVGQNAQLSLGHDAFDDLAEELLNGVGQLADGQVLVFWARLGPVRR